MGMVSNEDLNDEPFFGLIPVIVAVLPLNCPPQLRQAIQCSILRIQDKRHFSHTFSSPCNSPICILDVDFPLASKGVLGYSHVHRTGSKDL